MTFSKFLDKFEMSLPKFYFHLFESSLEAFLNIQILKFEAKHQQQSLKFGEIDQVRKIFLHLKENVEETEERKSKQKTEHIQYSQLILSLQEIQVFTPC